MEGRECLLVKTASEISLKTSFVRRFFTKKLLDSIKQAFKKNCIALESIAKSGGRLYIFCGQPKKAQKVLSTITGIHATAPAFYCELASLENLEKKVLEFAKGYLRKGDSFALDVNAKNSEGLKSKDVEEKVGARIMAEIPGLVVKLKEPGKKVFVEVGKKGFFIYTKQEPGLGGLPLGAEGSIAFLFEGKKDELLAAFLLMRRGCNIFPVVKKATPSLKKHLEKLVPFNAYRLFELTEEKDFAKLVREKNLKAVGTADSGFDVRSLERYAEFNKSQRLVVLRPLLLYPRESGKRFEAFFH